MTFHLENLKIELHRTKSEVRNPKPELENSIEFRPSDFFRISDFGFRISLFATS